jgi:hypothetical protein
VEGGFFRARGLKAAWMMDDVGVKEDRAMECKLLQFALARLAGHVAGHARRSAVP